MHKCKKQDYKFKVSTSTFEEPENFQILFGSLNMLILSLRTFTDRGKLFCHCLVLQPEMLTFNHEHKDIDCADRWLRQAFTFHQKLWNFTSRCGRVRSLTIRE